MGVLLSVLFLPLNNLIKLNDEINGNWFGYLLAKWKLKQQKLSYKKLPDHDFNKNDPQNLGVLPFDKEWELERPSKTNHEDVLIYGVNSSGQFLLFSIQWKPNGKRIKAKINFKLYDNNNLYSLNEEEQVDFNENTNEYKIAGISLEILVPLKSYRIKIRSYLYKNNTNELVFVRSRLLWFAISNCFDLSSDFNENFIAKELASNYSNGKLLFENQWEQFGQIKGNFQVENNKAEIIYLWGSKCKKILPKFNHETKIVKIIGYTSKGQGIHIGIVKAKNLCYRYGYGKIFYADLHPLKELSLNNDQFEQLFNLEKSINFKAIFGEEFNVKIKPKKENDVLNEIEINENKGFCLISLIENNDWQNDFVNEKIEEITNNSLVLSLNDEDAKLNKFSGGKGASLATLIRLSSQVVNENNKFIVPQGIVVTTNAYNSVIDENKSLRLQIDELQLTSSSTNKQNFKSKCEEVVNLITNTRVSNKVKMEIENNLLKLFGQNYEDVLFAVRSSGTSEDSEEMSSAGQMTTFLGVKGINQICESVMKCWASQFTFNAVEYKLNYGESVNSQMAVVIEQMVNCDSSGVIFTCDPVTGDERLITMTANYGLGETVVSATAEPDTIKLKVDLSSNNLDAIRRIKEIQSKSIGTKKIVMKIKDDGGTLYEEIENNNNCCVSDDHLIQLGQIALEIHKFYRNPRDIEWGIKDNQIYVLQSRPITNLDNSFSEYEIIHEKDDGHQSESEIFTRLHVAETFPRSNSYSYDFYFGKGIESSIYQNVVKIFGPSSDVKRYSAFYNSLFARFYNQVFFNLRTGVINFLENYHENKFAFEYAKNFFGFNPQNDEFLEMIKEKTKYARKITLTIVFKILWNVITTTFFHQISFERFKEQHKSKFNLIKEIKSLKSSKEIFDHLTWNLNDNPTFLHHSKASMASSMKSFFLKFYLQKYQDKLSPENIDLNTASLIISGDEVISAQPPRKIKRIAQLIKDKEKFVNLSDEDALKYLKSNDDEARKQFLSLLEEHGHRGYGEGDLMKLPWRDNPIPVIKSIKIMLINKDKDEKEKENKSIDEMLLSDDKSLRKFILRLILKYLLIPAARNGIKLREESRDLFMWDLDQHRQALYYLAQVMVKEDLIPEKELFFYLTCDELNQLIVNKNKLPGLIMKSRQRRKSFLKTDKYKFEQFCFGPNFKPINDESNMMKFDNENTIKMKGTTVFNGIVKARVCVAEDILQAEDLQNGDILITYATDIGWTPYFPIISGLVTEIGGTISHGAVVAREYGIPCLIAVNGACRVFKTGDICLLNTEISEIIKV